MAILSVPSWVIPGTYGENLRFLESREEIQGVELLFFIYNNEVKEQLNAEWELIQHYRERFVFTAHLPEPLLPGHEELILRLSPLVRHFIFHPQGNDEPQVRCPSGTEDDPAPQAGLLKEWTKRHGAVFLAENLYPSPKNWADTGFPLCLDTGHLLLEGRNPANFFRPRRDRVGEIHLHGLDQNRAALDGRLADHRRLREDDPWLREFLPLLKDYPGIINLEVFSWEEARAGIEVLRRMDYGKY